MKITKAQLEKAAEGAESCHESWGSWESVVERVFEELSINLEVTE